MTIATGFHSCPIFINRYDSSIPMVHLYKSTQYSLWISQPRETRPFLSPMESICKYWTIGTNGITTNINGVYLGVLDNPNAVKVYCACSTMSFLANGLCSPPCEQLEPNKEIPSWFPDSNSFSRAQHRVHLSVLRYYWLVLLSASIVIGHWLGCVVIQCCQEPMSRSLQLPY